MSTTRLVVIGASAGGVSALLALSASLPRRIPAPVLIVLHIGANPSVLPSLLSAHGNNPAVHAQDGERLKKGTLYVAPPERVPREPAIRVDMSSASPATRPHSQGRGSLLASRPMPVAISRRP